MFKRSGIYRKGTINLGGILSLAVTAFLTYYLLIKDKFLLTSISPVISWSGQCTKHWHAVAIGLVPIYLALMIFGASVISLYLGSALQRWLLKRWRE